MPSATRAAPTDLDRFRQALVLGMTGGLVANLVLAAVFFAFGLAPLGWISVGSCALFCTGFASIRAGMLGLPAALLFGEVVVHLLLVVRMIGFEAGFHYYLFGIAPLVFVVSPRTRWICSGIATTLAASVLVLDLTVRDLPPVLEVSAPTLASIRHANTVLAFALSSFSAWIFGQQGYRAERGLARAARTDALTGLGNRRRGTQLLARVLEDSATHGAPLSLIMVDIDHFKAVNDRYGHQAGDLVLRAVGAALTSAVRGDDRVFRWGGEEFLIVLPGTALAQAASVAERIRAAIERGPIALPDGTPIPVTATFGVAEHEPGEPENAWLKRADEALYEGKNAGRNRVQGTPPRDREAARSAA